MRNTHKLPGGITVEPRDVAGSRGYNARPHGWTVVYPDGRRRDTLQTLAEIRREHAAPKRGAGDAP